MNLSDQLKLVKLRKVTEPIRDFSSPKLLGFITQDECKTYQNEVLNCNFERWFDALKDCTFETEFCVIAYEDACLFKRIYEKFFKDKDLSVIEATNWRNYLTKVERDHFKSIEKRLESVINKFLERNSCVFVKTSSRSAKDSPLASIKFKTLYAKHLSECDDQQNENNQITSLLQAAFNSLKISNANEAIEMLIKSERIYQDFLLATDNPARFNENFVIRKFYDIDVDMEFRGFVYEMRLSALSQYNYLIWSKRLVENKDQIQKLIINYFNNQVLPKLNEVKFVKNFIIDFALIQKDQVKVIELNPFLETTDGALFSWNYDRHLIEASKGLTFRIVEQPRAGSRTMLPQSLRALLNAK